MSLNLSQKSLRRVQSQRLVEFDPCWNSQKDFWEMRQICHVEMCKEPRNYIKNVKILRSVLKEQKRGWIFHCLYLLPTNKQKLAFCGDLLSFVLPIGLHSSLNTIRLRPWKSFISPNFVAPRNARFAPDHEVWHVLRTLQPHMLGKNSMFKYFMFFVR